MVEKNLDKPGLDLKIGSLNVRGIRNSVKRLAIFENMRGQNFDIIFLQEAYCTEEIKTKWEEEWGGVCVFSNGSIHSCGTIIMFKKNLDIEIIEKVIDQKGRYVFLKVKFHNCEMYLGNIYSPTIQTGKNLFYKKIIETLVDLNVNKSDSIILAGDWNNVMNAAIDRKSCRARNDAESLPINLAQLIEIYELEDIWRLRNPKSSRFTYRQKNPLVQSRLDYFLTSNCVQNKVINTDIIPSVRSDHSIISINIYCDKQEKRGPGYWKFNTSLNDDITFVKEMKTKLVEWKEECREVPSKQLLWELLKYKIRNFAQVYSKKKRKMETEKHTSLVNNLLETEKLLAETPSETLLSQVEEIKENIAVIENNRVKGMIIRSKIDWHEKGEKNSKYFFGLEKNNYVKKTITSLKDGNRIITNPEDIRDIQLCFYRNLYQSKLERDNVSEEFFSSAVNTLSEEEKIQCEQMITKSELKRILKTFKPNKSPGNDGLSWEFYNVFWEDIVDPLYESYQESLDKGIMTTSQRQAVITLLEKKGKDKCFINNWRPISLLNFDYKLISKLISTRVQTLMDNLIHVDQKGFIKGRYMGDSIRVLQDIMDYTVHKDMSGILLFIDFEKAFDSLEWAFLWKALEKFNFGEKIIKWIRTMYEQPESCIMNNGYSTGYFKVERGVRQGDPLSPYLFILAAELLAINLRENEEVKGIVIEEVEFKVSLYADDVTLVLKDLSSAKEAINVIERFEKDSGLKMNRDKCEGMWLGKDRDMSSHDFHDFQFKWPKTPIKVLGVYISYNKDEAIRVNFEDKISGLLRQLHWWKARNLSLTGKVLIIKNIALSKFALLASLIHIPQNYVDQVNTMIYNFLWNGKCDKVKRKVVTLDYCHGGIGMWDFGYVISSAKIKWLRRYLSEERSEWKVFFHYYLGKENNNLFIRGNFPLGEIPKRMPDYYRDSLILWNKLKMKESDAVVNLIWYNRDFKIGSSTVFCQALFECGIWTVRDLFKPDGTLITFATWLRRGANNNSYLIWRGLVGLSTGVKRVPVGDHRVLNIGYLEIERPCYSLDFVSEKDIKVSYRYNTYLQVKEKSLKAVNTFNAIHTGYRLDTCSLADIYVLPRLCYVNNHTKDLQYKILHRYLPTQSLLYKMKKIESPTCLYCNRMEDSLEHFVYECDVIKRFWTAVFDAWNGVTSSNVRLDIKTVTFGLFHEQHFDWTKDVDRSGSRYLGENTIILLGKRYVFMQKLNNCQLSLRSFGAFVKQQLTLFENKDKNPCMEKLQTYLNSTVMNRFVRIH